MSIQQLAEALRKHLGLTSLTADRGVISLDVEDNLLVDVRAHAEAFVLISRLDLFLDAENSTQVSATLKSWMSKTMGWPGGTISIASNAEYGICAQSSSPKDSGASGFMSTFNQHINFLVTTRRGEPAPSSQYFGQAIVRP